MARNARLTLILKLGETDGDAIAGSLSGTWGTETTFVGWLGLASAIETALRDQQAATHTEPAQGGNA